VETVRRILPDKAAGLRKINIYTSKQTTTTFTPQQMAQLNRTLCDTKGLRFSLIAAALLFRLILN
jgi:hypothetical protein